MRHISRNHPHKLIRITSQPALHYLVLKESAGMSHVAYLDHLLRDREQVAADLQHEKKVTTNIRSCFWLFVGLSVIYGLAMGSHSLIHGRPDGWKYALAAGIKLPLMFLLTLAICLPLLYVLNVLIGPRARFKVVLGLLVASIAVTGIVFASCTLILIFFMLSTANYEFIKLLNWCIFSVAGLYGVWFLRKGMMELDVSIPSESSTPDQAAAESKRGIGTIMNWWLVTYGIVGAQMAWLMRPFIGSPDTPFSLFRAQESNIYIEIVQSFGRLLGM
jgi:hypothetical protein